MKFFFDSGFVPGLREIYAATCERLNLETCEQQEAIFRALVDATAWLRREAETAEPEECEACGEPMVTVCPTALAKSPKGEACWPSREPGTQVTDALEASAIDPDASSRRA